METKDFIKIKSQHFFHEADVPMYHCPALMEHSSGKLFITWYQGSMERAKDVKIMLSYKENPNGTWSSPVLVEDTIGKSNANPILCEYDGEIIMIYGILQGKKWDSANLFFKKSKDLGKTWSESKEILHEIKGSWMVRNKSINLKDGTLMVPVYEEQEWISAAMTYLPFKDDWSLGATIQATNRLIQPTIVELDNGTLLSYMRSDHQSKCIWKAMSINGGKSWSRANEINMPNNNSSLDLLKLNDGRLLMAYNHSDSMRTPLSIAISSNYGESWPLIQNIESEHGEFSYPSVIQVKDSSIYLAYSYQREKIKVVELCL